MPENFDVAVVGAGPAGAATARRLARSGCRVVLLEHSTFDEPRVGESLSPAVQPLLRDLGVWSEFLALQPLPSHGTQSLWGDAEPQCHSHVFTAWCCGWHVDRLGFDQMLAQAAQSAGATLHCATKLVGCDWALDHWELHLVKHTCGSKPHYLRFTAKIVIDATGRGARVARCLGADRLLFDRLVGIAQQFNGVEVTNEGFLTVETASEGWWYTAPMPGGRMLVMLMTDSDLCARGGFASHSTWVKQLQTTQLASKRLARAIPISQLRVCSAISQRLQRHEMGKPWLTVGDAALSVDPISGSGVVRALRSAAAGAEVALKLLGGRTVDTIATYEAERNAECSAYIHERAMYYGTEQRWSESVFWQRRSTVVGKSSHF